MKKSEPGVCAPSSLPPPKMTLTKHSMLWQAKLVIITQWILYFDDVKTAASPKTDRHIDYVYMFNTTIEVK